MSALYEKFTHAELVVKIEFDSDPPNPRAWDSLGVMHCEHRRYRLGDGKSVRPTEDMEVVVELPIYLYDHSGLAISSQPFSCPWDSGRLGIIYVTKERFLREYSTDTPEHRAQALACLQQELDTYNEFLSGQVYTVLIETEEGVLLDSLSGIFGLEQARKEAQDMARICAVNSFDPGL